MDVCAQRVWGKSTCELWELQLRLPIAMGQYGHPGELGVKQSARRKRLPLQEQVL